MSNTCSQRLLLSVLVLLFAWSKTTAQSYFTLFSANYAQAAQEVISTHPVYQSVASNLALPIQLKNENKILTGLAYQQSSLVFDSIPLHQNFYSLGLSVGFLKKTKKGSILTMAIVRMNTDFVKLSQKSYQVGGVILVNRILQDKLTIKYGLYYNGDRFGPFFAPLLGIDWKASNKWRVFGIMPQSLSIENKISSVFRWGLAYFSPNLTFQTNAPQTNLYLHQSQTRIGLFTDVYPAKKIALTLKVDYPVFVKYSVYEDTQKYAANIWGIGIGGTRNASTKPIEKLHHSLIYQLGISYRIELE